MEWFASDDAREVYFCPCDSVLEQYDVFELREGGVSASTRFGRKYDWKETVDGSPPHRNYAWAILLDDTTAQLHCT